MSVQKRKSNQNQPTKQKQTNKKQQRQQFFRHKKFWQGENWLFCALIFFVRSKSFRKKNRLAWSCLDSFIYNTTETSQKLSSLWASHCSDFEQVKKLFFYFEQVKNLLFLLALKNLLVILLALNKLKVPFGETPWLTGRHATPLVTLFSGVTMLLTGRHAMPVVI